MLHAGEWKWTGKGYSHEEVIQEAPQAGGSLEEVVHIALHASLGVVRAVWEAGGGGKRDGGDGEGLAVRRWLRWVALWSDGSVWSIIHHGLQWNRRVCRGEGSAGHCCLLQAVLEDVAVVGTVF